MPIKSIISDGAGTNTSAEVLKTRSLRVRLEPVPADGELFSLPFRDYFRDSDANIDMRVDGSSSEKIFSIGSSQTRNRYITTISFVISDASPKLNQFGSITALTNGCQLIYSQQSEEIIIHESLQTNFDFVRLCLGNPAFGTTTNAFYASNVSATSEAFLPVLDFKMFGFPYGLKLGKGTEQKLSLKIRDDVSAIDQFDIIAYGFEVL